MKTELTRRTVHGIALYGEPEWQEILNLQSPPQLDESIVKAICKILEPKTKVSLTGNIRTFAGLTNLELISPKADHFHRIYKGLHISRRDRAVLHLYDISASDEKNALEIARREYEILQRLQKSLYLPRILDSFQDASEYPGELFFYSIVDPLVPSLSERAKDPSLTTQERFQTALNIAEGLASLHEPQDPDVPPIIHRNLTPESIRIKTNGQPIFINLDLAKLPGAISVSRPSISFEGRERYVAPEVLKHGLSVADTKSDIFAMCASLMLLFEGIPEDAKMARQLLVRGLSENPEDRIILTELIKEFLSLAGRPETREKEIPPVQYWDEDTIIPFKDSEYRILCRLGSGGIGTTFKVLEVDKKQGLEFGSYVAKVIFNRENGESALQAYRKVRAHSTHPHLAVIHEIAPAWEENQVMVLMKWVDGMPLSDLTGVLPLHAEDLGEPSCESLVLRWLHDLCDALSALHRVGLVYGDMSPKNIIVSGGDVTLTDFDAVVEVGVQPRITTTCYTSGTVQQYNRINPSDDVFALAASFFQVLFEKEPFRFGGEFQKSRGVNWQGINKSDWPLVAKFFDKATNPASDQRFSSAIEAMLFIKELQTHTAVPVEKLISPPKEEERLIPNIAPRLMEILCSYPGSLKGNVETRGLDSVFAEKTYVETRLDSLLLEEIQNRKVSLVILFGNAGDGKTAFLQHLGMRLGLRKYHSSERLWDHILPSGIRVRANLDGCAAFHGKTATELLGECFRPFHDLNPPENLVHLIAINSGPLQAWILDYEQRFGQTPFTTQLDAVLDGDLKQLDKSFLLIDLNSRSLVGGIDEVQGIITTDFFDSLIEKFLGDKTDDPWQPCLSCCDQHRCTAWESVQILRQEKMGKLVRGRFCKAIQAVHQRGEVHITARELRSAISYIFFGLYYCSDLHENPDLHTGHYYDRTFDPTSQARQGDLLKELVYLDPALEAHPKIDRYLLGHDKGGGSVSPPHYPNLWLSSARRRAYFEWTDEEIQRISSDKGYFGLARGRYLEKFREFPLISLEEKKHLCYDLCKGIAMLEDLPPIAFRHTEGIPMKITPRTPIESTLWVLKPFRRFDVCAEIDSSLKDLEKLHTHLVLIYRYDDGTEEKLILGATLFHILMALKDGVQISDAASEDIFANLSIFKQRLAHEDTREFYAWNPIEEDAVFKIAAVLKENTQTITCSRISSMEGVR